MNRLEVREVRLFAESELPETLAMGMSDMLSAARRRETPMLE
jgi:hypothetical protein